jgi:hypothetical protein
VLHLAPLLIARRRLERLAGLSASLAVLSRRHRWLSLPLLPVQLGLRQLSRRASRRVERAYNLPPQSFRSSRR